MFHARSNANMEIRNNSTSTEQGITHRPVLNNEQHSLFQHTIFFSYNTKKSHHNWKKPATCHDKKHIKPGKISVSTLIARAKPPALHASFRFIQYHTH